MPDELDFEVKGKGKTEKAARRDAAKQLPYPIGTDAMEKYQALGNRVTQLPDGNYQAEIVGTLTPEARKELTAKKAVPKPPTKPKPAQRRRGTGYGRDSDLAGKVAQYSRR